MDNHRPMDKNPPSQEEAKYPVKEDHSNKDGARKVFPYSVKEQANSKAAGR